MGEFKDRSDLIYDNLIERLEEEGYIISTSENNKIVGLIRDEQLEDSDAFEQLVNDAIKTINYIRSENVSEGFQCSECGEEITFGTNAGTGRCINCESEVD
ncbi:hypothetical protein [Clostridium sp. KNHs214]|uniref:hypothetical protein n=1 Tax=Clostridium sp. KNHs214 TaxID=1540257 RepID=UPI000558F98B|nr:hypothetical protein [Clostridium sp. KNHs214]